MRTIKNAYEIGIGSVIVFSESMFFAGMVTAWMLYFIYKLFLWAVWVLSL